MIRLQFRLLVVDMLEAYSLLLMLWFLKACASAPLPRTRNLGVENYHEGLQPETPVHINPHILLVVDVHPPSSGSVELKKGRSHRRQYKWWCEHIPVEKEPSFPLNSQSFEATYCNDNSSFNGNLSKVMCAEGMYSIQTRLLRSKMLSTWYSLHTPVARCDRRVQYFYCVCTDFGDGCTGEYPPSI